MKLPREDFRLLRIPSCQTSEIGLIKGAITANNTSTWTHCGPLLDIDHFPSSFHRWAAVTFNGNMLPLLNPFLSFVHAFLSEAKMDHYWITIRAVQATKEFELARWHTDFKYFDRPEDKHWKLATTLIGPGTLFLRDGVKGRKAQAKARKAVKNTKLGQHGCLSFRCLGCSDMQDIVREQLAREFESLEIVQAQNGECAFMRLSDESGAMHSEPHAICDRIFVNVIPGKEHELRSLSEKWGMEFPRSWSIGVLLNHEEPDI
jgi:hypothetical protein